MRPARRVSTPATHAARRASRHMKGARDEAYLAVYRVKADAKARARLAELRRSAAYRSEQRAAQAEAAKPAASAPASPLEQQCRGAVDAGAARAQHGQGLTDLRAARASARHAALDHRPGRRRWRGSGRPSRGRKRWNHAVLLALAAAVPIGRKAGWICTCACGAPAARRRERPRRPMRPAPRRYRTGCS